MKRSQNLKLVSDSGVCYLKFLPWDTQFFGRPSYILDLKRSKLEFSSKFKSKVRSLTNCFISAKIDTIYDNKILNVLYSLGFKYIDTEVTLKYKKNRKVRLWRRKSEAITRLRGLEIKKIKKNINLPYVKLGSSFRFTRFHHDSCISKEKADLLWINYLESYKIDASHHVYIAQLDKEVTSAILLNHNARRRQAVISFVAVIDKFRGMRVGTSLIQHVVRRFQNLELFTGTQISNISALNFYIKNGFLVIKNSKVVLHRWS